MSEIGKPRSSDRGAVTTDRRFSLYEPLAAAAVALIAAGVWALVLLLWAR